MFEDRCADFIIIVSRKDLACKPSTYCHFAESPGRISWVPFGFVISYFILCLTFASILPQIRREMETGPNFLRSTRSKTLSFLPYQPNYEKMEAILHWKDLAMREGYQNQWPRPGTREVVNRKIGACIWYRCWVDVYNLGLDLHEIHLDEAGTYRVVMTFTDTACSCAESLPIEIVSRLKGNRWDRRCQGWSGFHPLGKLHESADTGASPLVFHHDNNHYHLVNAVN